MDLAASGELLIIAQNGEVKLDVQDVHSDGETRFTLALL